MSKKSAKKAPSKKTVAATKQPQPAPQTTTVDIVVRIQVAGSPPWSDVARWRSALECLGEVMAVQTEDGLWTLGHAEAETDEGPSEHVADIERAVVHSVRIAGLDDLVEGEG